MMTTKATTVGAVAVVTTLALGLVGPAVAGDGSGTPDAFSDGFDLDEFAQLSGAFNEEQDSVRLVALLSASCGYCIKGYRYMRKLLEEIPDPRLKMMVAWEPMLSGDTRELSLRMARKADDPRMVYQAWDEERITGDTFTALLSAEDEFWHGGDNTAWDVYFLYERGVSWSADRPTKPTYWQHQGAGPTETALNYANLKAEIETRLAQLPPLQADAGGE